VKVGDLVQVNDLCREASLRGAVGTIIATNIKGDSMPWPMMQVMINGIIHRFTYGTSQLELVT